MIGFALAIAVGLLLGVAIGASPLIYSGLYPLLIAFNAVPKVAIVPILMIWVGVGSAARDRHRLRHQLLPDRGERRDRACHHRARDRDVLRSLGATRLEILRKVGIPRAMPYLFASLKVAITLAFIGSVISETVGGNRGIGFLMLPAASQFRTPLMFAGVAVIAAMGIATYLIFVLIEQRFTGWAMRKHNMPVVGGG